MKTVLAILAISGLAAWTFETTEPMPDHALVYCDSATRTYLAPQRVSDTTGLVIATAQTARSLSYQPDRISRDEGYFLGVSTSGVRHVLQWVRLAPKKQSRWNPDGSWNW